MTRRIPGPLYFERIGASGTVMIFLHSSPSDHRLWLYQTAHFSSLYRTIAVDLAGYGRSPAVQEGVTIDDQADACWEVVDRFSSAGTIIHGCSLGSEVAMHMAQRRPERTRALILSGCAYLPKSEIWQGWVKRYRDEGIALRRDQLIQHFLPERQKDPFVAYFADMVTALDNAQTLASIVAMNEALARRPAEAFYAQLCVPTLILSGTADRHRPATIELQRRIAGAELATIEGAGHCSGLHEPAAYDAHCIRFLSRLGLYPGPSQEIAV